MSEIEIEVEVDVEIDIQLDHVRDMDAGLNIAVDAQTSVHFAVANR